MDRMPWFKWWDGTASDPKLRMIAEECGQSVAVVVGIWAYLLEKASTSADRGEIPESLDISLMAYVLKLPASDIETVRNGMKRAGLVTENGTIAKWEERQAKREKSEPPGASTERVRRMREKQKQQQNKDLGNDYDGNGDVTDETARNGMKPPKKKKEIEKKNKPKPPSSSGDDGFGEFWEAYPRKVGKQDAHKAWVKIKPDADKQHTILEAIAAQKEGHDWRRDDGAYIPHPTTWLNGGRWLDEVRPYTPPPARRNTDAWWTDRETMIAKGLTFDPPIHPLQGDSINTFKRRIQEAIERGDEPAPAAQPTPYVPPMPAGGEGELSLEQRRARLAEFKQTTGMKTSRQSREEASNE